jgi:hypothetical protein
MNTVPILKRICNTMLSALTNAEARLLPDSESALAIPDNTPEDTRIIAKSPTKYHKCSVTLLHANENASFIENPEDICFICFYSIIN